MANNLARFISVVFHPLLIPTYSFSLLALLYPHGLEPIPPASHSVFIILIFIVTFALPLLNISILKAFGFVKSYQMPTRSERIVPFVLVSVIYIAITCLFFWKSRIALSDNFMKFMIIIDMLVIVATILTVFMKVSIHSLTVWGVIGILIPLNKVTGVEILFYPALIMVALAGIIMSCRLILQVHTLREVLLGSVAGLATSIVGMMIFFGF
jgi:hypothetical protein